MSAGLAAVMNATLRVLIVEDDSRYRSMLMTMLRDLQCEPWPAASAVEALEFLKSREVDLILLDLNMPRMDGLTFLKQMRQQDQTTAVVILTGVGALPAAQAAIRLGVVEFLTKPCHLGVMEATLDRVRRMLAQRAEPTTDVGADGPAFMSAKGAASPSPSPAQRPILPPPSPPATLAELERYAILSALAQHNGNRSAAATALGISRRTMHYRLAEYRQAGLLDSANAPTGLDNKPEVQCD